MSFELLREELSKSISLYRAEANVVSSWIKFMEHSWDFRSSLEKKKDKQVNDELISNSRHHVDLIMQLLPAYENGLGFLIARLKVLARRLKSNAMDKELYAESLPKQTPVDEETLLITSNKESLEEEYHDLEEKLTNAFILVESIKQNCTESVSFNRQGDHMVKDLFNDFDKMKEEFKSTEKPTLQLQEEKPKQQLSWSGKPLKLPPKGSTYERQKLIKEEYSKLGPIIDGQNFLDSEEPTPLSESAKLSQGPLTPDIIDWEFDALQN